MIRVFSFAAVLSTAMAGSALANPNWTGFYLGVQAGYADHNGTQVEIEVPDIINEVYEFPISGAAVGAHAGYNHQMGEWVVGIEGDVEFSDITGTNDLGSDDYVFEDINWLGSLRLRTGYTDGAILIYAAGGLAVGGVDMLAIEGNPVFRSISGDDTPWGYTVGGGVEFAFSPNWSGRIEYRWTDLDDTSISGNIYSNNFIYTYENELSAVRIGATYHLN